MYTQSTPRSGDNAGGDSHTLAVAEHGVDPEVPTHRAGRGAHAAPRNNGSGWQSDTWRLGVRDLLIWSGIPIVVVLLIRLLIFGQYFIPSGSMMNTIDIGDRVLTSKLAPKLVHLQRGDVVVFKDPAHWLQDEQTSFSSDYLIKRLIALPGDKVACAGPGKPVTVNGVPIDETAYIRPGVDPSSFAFNVTVTAGHIFVMGDNRSNSADSRYHQDDGSHGLVPVDDVVGVGLLTYWPISRFGALDAHHEVFDNVPDSSSNS